MPYLKSVDKKCVERFGGKKLIDYYSSMKPQEFAGHVNYLNYLLVKRWTEKNGKRYWILALMIGTLICCVFEIYRRIVAPYEESAIQKNGDVE